jgi:hypothetical protein
MRLTSGGVLLQFDSRLVVGTLEVSTSAEVLLSFVPANNAVTSSWGANLNKPNSSAGYLLNPGCYGAEESLSPQPFDYEPDARRRPGRLQTDLACSPWGPVDRAGF